MRWVCELTTRVKLGGDRSKPAIDYTIKLFAYTFNTGFMSFCADLKARQ